MVADYDNATTAATLRFRMVRQIKAEVRLNDRGQVLENGSAWLSGVVRCNRPGGSLSLSSYGSGSVDQRSAQLVS